ncbi:MAG: YbjN domain-containing protein [Deltaproteobacteria bacterium]|nr:YbjN domain-containing protein [Deltaproteobacteria bacterium]
MGRARSASPAPERRPRRKKAVSTGTPHRPATVAQVADRVADFLIDQGLAPERSGDGPFVIRFGSTVVMVQVFEAERRPWVRIASVVLTGFRPSLDLLVRILHLNTQVVTGAFLLFEDDTLSFATTLPGEDLAPEAFRIALLSVARVSDDLDDELQALAGGRRAVDLVEPG